MLISYNIVIWNAMRYRSALCHTIWTLWSMLSICLSLWLFMCHAQVYSKLNEIELLLLLLNFFIQNLPLDLWLELVLQFWSFPSQLWLLVVKNQCTVHWLHWLKWCVNVIVGLLFFTGLFYIASFTAIVLFYVYYAHAVSILLSYCYLCTGFHFLMWIL